MSASDKTELAFVLSQIMNNPSIYPPPVREALKDVDLTTTIDIVTGWLINNGYGGKP